MVLAYMISIRKLDVDVDLAILFSTTAGNHLFTHARAANMARLCLEHYARGCTLERDPPMMQKQGSGIDYGCTLSSPGDVARDFNGLEMNSDDTSAGTASSSSLNYNSDAWFTDMLRDYVESLNFSTSTFDGEQLLHQYLKVFVEDIKPLFTRTIAPDITRDYLAEIRTPN